MLQASIINCAKCSKAVADPNAEAVQCGYCYQWQHCYCVPMPLTERHDWVVWSCSSCVSEGKFSAAQPRGRRSAPTKAPATPVSVSASASMAAASDVICEEKLSVRMQLLRRLLLGL